MDIIENKIIKENNVIKHEADSTTQYLYENIDKSLIIFCNPLSGNKEGKKILYMMSHYISKEKYRLIDYQYLVLGKKYEPIKVIFFEIINREDNEKGK